MAKPRSRAVLKKILKKKQGGRQLYGIKQGVGKITRSAFPKGGRRRPGKKSSVMRQALNAMHPCHLPLPRAVGGYTTIRTTDVVNTTQEAVLFGVLKGIGNEFTETCWLTNIAVTSQADMDLPINDPGEGGNARFVRSSALGAESLNGAKMVPAAITVQVMNSQSLQSADGIAYIGRSKTVLDLMGDSRSWKTVMDELVSYSAPRLCSAGKLSLRGVQVNAIPNNMSVLSDFVPRRIGRIGRQTWAEPTGADPNSYQADFEGFGPIFVYNPDKIPLKFLVTIEWRMRFDPLNPAYAGHIVHPPASESTWSKVISDAESMGHGVMDIADVAADIGAVGMVAAPFLL